MNFKNFLALGALAIAFSGCQIKVTEEPSNDNAGSIFGDWSTNCMADGNDSFIKVYSIQGGPMLSTYAAYYYTGDRYCNAAHLDMTVIQSGTMTVLEDNTLISAKNYEFKLSSLFLAPGSNNSAAGLNAGAACGYNDWAKDASKLVFGCFAPGAFDVSQVIPNTTHFGIVSIETSVQPNYLQFGSQCTIAGYEEFCPTALDRPSTLEGTVFYKR